MSANEYSVPPPDEEEQLLERLVFGYTDDFHSSVAGFDADLLFQEHEDEMEELEANDDSDLEAGQAVDDDALFFVDDGEDKMDLDDNVGEESSSESSDAESDAWVDSDDEKLEIPITNNTNRIKKLRKSYQESRISGLDYVSRLRAQYEKIYARPKWADEYTDSDNSDADVAGSGDEAEDGVVNGDVHALLKILEGTITYKDTSESKLLPSKILDIELLKDGNASHRSKSAIQSLSFHPTKPLMLTGGYDKTLRVYHIDGKRNQLVTSLHLKGSPVQTCTFYVSLDGKAEQKIYSAGRRRYMHSWDLNTSLTNAQHMKVDKLSRMYGHESTQRSFERFKVAHFFNKITGETHSVIMLQGSNGWINILHGYTGVWLSACKIEGTLVDFCIDYKPIKAQGFQTLLIAVNSFGEVWEFDLNNDGKVLRKWKDVGGVGITSIQVGGGTSSNHLIATRNEHIRRNRWLAVGSSSGYVNLYNRFDGNKLVASLDHLTTTISTLAFSPDGQILCMASRAIKDALRLVHLPSCTVFTNWPTSGTPLGKVTCASFSPGNEMLAVGNEQGKVKLWKLNHY